MLVLVTWADAVVLSGMSLRGPDMSQADMRIEAVSEETAWSNPWLWAELPTWFVWGDGPGHYNRVSPRPRGPELPAADSSLFRP